MVTNPFSTDALLYPLTKGDVSGHPFHGNQWQSGVAYHAGKAEEHRAVGKEYAAEAQNSNDPDEQDDSIDKSDRHFDVAQLHDKASSLIKADVLAGKNEMSPESQDASDTAIRATRSLGDVSE